MPIGKYDEALGLTASQKVPVSLTVQGVTQWAVSKAPAMLGGQFADWVYDWANKKWPDYKRGAQFVGGVAVMVSAFGLQLVATKYQANLTRMADKMTDGMVGRVSPVLWRLFKGLFGNDNAAAPNTQQGARKLTAGEPVANGVASLDGDREAIMEVGQLLHASPETTDQLANAMADIMQRDNVDMNAAGRAALVRSMREAQAHLANGRF